MRLAAVMLHLLACSLGSAETGMSEFLATFPVMLLPLPTCTNAARSVSTAT
jgi:hypothetical protein